MKFVFAASPLSTQQQGQRLLGRIQDNVSEWGVKSNVDCCFCELAQKDPIKCVGVVQSGYHYHLIECRLFSP
jgi:hypothetical protein